MLFRSTVEPKTSEIAINNNNKWSCINCEVPVIELEGEDSAKVYDPFINITDYSVALNNTSLFFDLLKPLIIIVSSNAQEGTNQYVDTADAFNLNHTLNIINGKIEINPSMGVVTEKFRLNFINWILMNNTKVETFIKYDDWELVDEEVIDKNIFDKVVELKEMEFKDFSASFEPVTKEFELKIKVTFGDEVLVYYNNITLTSEFKPTNISSEGEKYADKSIVSTEENLGDLTKYLINFKFDETSNSDCTKGGCNDKGECVNSKCECIEGYSGSLCQYSPQDNNNAEIVLDKVKEYLTEENIKNMDYETFTGIALNMGKISEITGNDETAELYKYVSEFSKEIGNDKKEMEKYSKIVTYILDAKVKALGNNETNTLNAEEQKKIVSNLTEVLYKTLTKTVTNGNIGDSTKIENKDFSIEVKKDKIDINSKEYTLGVNKGIVSFSKELNAEIIDAIGTNVITRIVEWKHNPHMYAPSASKINSSIISFSFVNENNGSEISMALKKPITLKFNLNYRPQNLSSFRCNYFDEQKGDFTGECDFPTLDSNNYLICNCYHMSDYGVVLTPYEVSAKQPITDFINKSDNVFTLKVTLD